MQTRNRYFVFAPRALRYCHFNESCQFLAPPRRINRVLLQRRCNARAINVIDFEGMEVKKKVDKVFYVVSFGRREINWIEPSCIHVGISQIPTQDTPPAVPD